MKKPTETGLVRACLELLALRGVFAWRANSGGGLRRGKGGRTVPVRANPAGTPDILAVVPGGRLVGIECKLPGGKRRPAQQAWADNAQRAGALCWLVDDVGALDGQLQTLLHCQ
jgi:hypothetical protein